MRQVLCQTTGLPNNQGPLAQTLELNLDDAPGHPHLEAWLSNFGSSNVHIFSGGLSQAECLNRLESGFIDCLMTLTGSGVSRRALPDSTRYLTVFFEAQNTSGQFQAVTFRVVK